MASRYYKLVSRYYELASRYNEVVARYYDLVSRYYELVSRYNELVSRYFEDFFFSFFFFKCPYRLIYESITINNGTLHLKPPKNQNRRAALGRPAIKD